MKKSVLSILLCGFFALNSFSISTAGAAGLEEPLSEEIDIGEAQDTKEPEYIIDKEEELQTEEVLEEKILIKEETLGEEESTDLDTGTESVPFDEKHFPDAGFREALGKYDLNADGIFSREEIGKVTSLYLPSDEDHDVICPAQDITGIEYFTCLESLTFGGFPLTNTFLDLTNNTKLKALDAKYSGLTEINLSGNGELIELILPGSLESIKPPVINKVEKLHVGKISSIQEWLHEFTQLKEFKLDENTNQDIDLSQTVNFSWYPQLEHLELDANNLFNLDVTENPKLQVLDVDNLVQNELNLSFNQELKILILKGNPADMDFKLNISDNNELEEIHLAVPSLSNINLDGKINLKKLILRCTNSKIQSLDFSQCPDLKELSLSAFDWETLDITALSKINILSISMDSITELDLSKNTNLKVLTIKSSSLGFIYMEVPKIQSTFIEQTRDIRLDSNYSFDLKEIPGYRANMYRSIENAKLSGSKIYPTSTEVIYKYYINKNKNKVGTFKFNITSPLRPTEVKGVSVTNQTDTTINCKWNKQSGIDGYVVYARNIDTDKVEKRINVKKVTSCKISGLKAGGKYAVTVRAYKKIGDKNRYSDYKTRATKVVFTLPAKPTLKVSTSGTKVKCSWNNKKVASKSADSGYLVYYSTKKGGPYTRLALLPDTKNSYTTDKLKKGKTYYFKMRAYIRNQDKSQTTFSRFSNVVMKKL